MWEVLSQSFVFFFKQKTAYEIVSRDWSSDVCSSDLTFDLSNCVQLCFVSMIVQNDYRDVILSHMFANERNMKNKFPYIVPCVFLFLNFKMYVLVILITMVVSLSMD